MATQDRKKVIEFYNCYLVWVDQRNGEGCGHLRYEPSTLVVDPDVREILKCEGLGFIVEVLWQDGKVEVSNHYFLINVKLLSQITRLSNVGAIVQRRHHSLEKEMDLVFRREEWPSKIVKPSTLSIYQNRGGELQWCFWNTSFWMTRQSASKVSTWSSLFACITKKETNIPNYLFSELKIVALDVQGGKCQDLLYQDLILIIIWYVGIKDKYVFPIEAMEGPRGRSDDAIKDGFGSQDEATRTPPNKDPLVHSSKENQAGVGT